MKRLRFPLTTQKLRRGFTLVELMVSMALTLFIMTILVEAFGAGMTTFQNLRALGDVQDTLRSALHVIKYDLGQDHFEGGRKMSDAGFWDEKRREGFFSLTQKTAPESGTYTTKQYVDEGWDTDSSQNKSMMARDHILHFAVRLKGNRRENFMVEPLPAAYATLATMRTNAGSQATETFFGPEFSTSLVSQWAEVAYFLSPAGGNIPDSTATNPPYGPIVLHNLYRTQLVAVPFADTANTSFGFSNANLALLRKLSVKLTATGGNFQFFSPNDFAAGKGAAYRSFNPAIAPYDISRASLVCTNVVSFQVRILKDTGTIFEDLPTPGINTPFDTSDATPNPVFRVIGVQVILRIYDPSSGLTRQATLTQDL